MYRRMTAFDFDGTLAVDSTVPDELECALEKCRGSGQALFWSRDATLKRSRADL
jgi:hydroxymethylpyrimidine pyrophosphatase-like HAD family hydrolase